MCLPFTSLLHSYWGIFAKFKVKRRNIISTFFTKMSLIYKNSHNTGIILEIYEHCATFASRRNLVMANKFCPVPGPSLYQGSTVTGNCKWQNHNFVTNKYMYVSRAINLKTTENIIQWKMLLSLKDRLPPRSNPLPFYILFSRKRYPLIPYTFYWQMVPLPHTLFRILHPF